MKLFSVLIKEGNEEKKNLSQSIEMEDIEEIKIEMEELENNDCKQVKEEDKWYNLKQGNFL